MRNYEVGDSVTAYKPQSDPGLTPYNVGKTYVISETSKTNPLLLHDRVAAGDREDGSRKVLMRADIRPTYWMVERSKDPRFRLVISYINTLQKGNGFSGDVYNYFGYDGDNTGGGASCYLRLNESRNSAFLLTLDEWCAFGYDASPKKQLSNFDISRKDLLSLHKEWAGCLSCQSTVENYLYLLGVLAGDEDRIPIYQEDIERISLLNSEQKKALSHYLPALELSRVYKCGQHFRCRSAIFVLMSSGYYELKLVNIQTGLMWKNDGFPKDRITQAELDAYIGINARFFEPVGIEVSVNDQQ